MAAKTWVGTTDSLWSTATNWVELAVPATTDAVTFNVTGTARACTVDALGTWSGGTLTIDSAYANTITQNTGININTAAFSMASGTFTCHSAATFTSTTFSVTGGTFNQGGAFVSTTFGCTSTGTFVGSSATMSTTAVTFSNTANLTATSNTWTLAGSWTTSNSPTFAANSGTINITAASTFNTGAITLNKVNVNATNAFVTLSAGGTFPFGASPTTSNGTNELAISGTATWSGAWTHTGSWRTNNGSTVTGTSTPTLSVSINFTINATTTVTNPIGTVSMPGTSAGNFSDTSDAFSGSTFVIGSGGSKTVNITAGNCRLGSSPTIDNGSGGFTVASGSTLTWSGALSVVSNFTASSGSTLTGSSTPTISASKNLTIGATVTVTNAIGTITFNGTANGTVTDTGDKLSGTTFTVNKTSTGTFTIAASTNARFGSDPTITMGSGAVTITGTLTWSGICTFTTTGTVTTSNGSTLTGSSTPQLKFAAGVTITNVTTITNAIGTITMTGTTTSTITDASNLLSGSTWVLGDGSNKSITVAASTSVSTGAAPTSNLGTGTLTITGTLTFSGTWALTAGSLTGAGTITGSSTPVVALTEGAPTFTNLTLTNALGLTMNITSATARTITGAAKTYGAFTRTGSGSGSLTWVNADTYGVFTDNVGSVAHSLIFTAAQTVTVADFIVAGAASKLVTIVSSSSGNAATLHTTGGAVSASYVSVKDSTVDASPTWTADANSTLVSGNTNWLQSAAPSTGGGDTIHQIHQRSTRGRRPFFLRSKLRTGW